VQVVVKCGQETTQLFIAARLPVLLTVSMTLLLADEVDVILF